MEREAFLARVRSSVDACKVSDVPTLDPEGLVPALPPVDPLTGFATAARKVDAVVHTGEPRLVIESIVARHGAGPFMAWDDEHLPVDGIVDRLSNAGCRRVRGVVPPGSAERLHHQRGYVDLRFGLTGAEAAFAESGTIVIRSGPGKPRMASLIPLVHIALLPAGRIFRSQMHWLMLEGAGIAEAANVVYITGPSRTADIEQQINLGVHGPREVHIVVI